MFPDSMLRIVDGSREAMRAICLVLLPLLSIDRINRLALPPVFCPLTLYLCAYHCFLP